MAAGDVDPTPSPSSNHVTYLSLVFLLCFLIGSHTSLQLLEGQPHLPVEDDMHNPKEYWNCQHNQDGGKNLQQQHNNSKVETTANNKGVTRIKPLQCEIKQEKPEEEIKKSVIDKVWEAKGREQGEIKEGRTGLRCDIA